MSAKSLELLTELTKRGTISKEAAEETLALRERIIQKAMAKTAAGGFNRLRPIGKAVGGVYNAIKSRLGHGGFSPSPGAGAGSPGWGDVASNLSKMLGLATLTAAASSGIGGFMKRRKDKEMQGDIENSYQMMQEISPDVRQLIEERPDSVKRAFGVMARFAPSLAAEPSVASAFVFQTVGNSQGGAIGPEVIKALAETQRKIDEMQEGRSGISSHFDRGINLATRAMSPSSGPPPGKSGKP